MIYFDNAATSYYRPACVSEAVSKAIDTFGNPSRGAYDASLSANRCLFETRLQLAQMFGADGPDCVSFTMNATQALNEAIFGQNLGPGDHLIVSREEHNSVLRPAYRLQAGGVNVHFARLKRNGTFDIDDYRKILRQIRGDAAGQTCAFRASGCKAEPDTVSKAGLESAGKSEPRIVTALAHGSNVTGNVIDLGAVSRLCREYGSLLIVDAAQTAGILPIDMEKDGIDILCMSGHKALMGPQGTGAIIVRRGVSVDSLMVGGSGIKTFLETMPEDMPAHLEAGTQNAHSIAGLHAALTYSDGKREEWRRSEMRLKQQFLDGIEAINKEDKLCYSEDRRTGPDGYSEVIRVYGDPYAEESLPTVSFNVRGFDAGDIADRLWRDKEIAVRAGGHCAPLIHRFFGTENRGIVRASFSHYNTKEQIATLIEELRCIAQEV